MAELLTISGCDNPDRELDLIFVHGLDGDGRSTWQKDNNSANFWPGWLGEEYPNIGIWSLDYEANAIEWKGRSMPLYDRARDSLDRFDLEEIGRRPIGFVCHSLGGLLVKEILRLANENDDWQPVVEQTRFIIFLSTPHSVADLANWINYIGKLLRTGVSVKELEANNPNLLQLNAWYRNNAGKLNIKTYVYYETYPTNGILVVNATSADPGIAGVNPIPLDYDHITICKPADKSQSVYRRVKRFLNETLAIKLNPKPDHLSKKPDAEQTKLDNEAHQTSPENPYSGEAKLTFCNRLGHSWTELADLLEIPPYHQAQFDKGLEPKFIWEWLENKGQLNKLHAALDKVGRNDLARDLNHHPT